MPTEASAFDIKRAEVVLNLARLNLERTKRLSDRESIITHMQWQLDELRHQMLELKMKLSVKT